jgi:hypothetical protein
MSDGTLKTHEYRLKSTSLAGYGAKGILQAIKDHVLDAGLRTEGDYRSFENLSRAKNRSPKPPWTIQAKLTQDDRSAFDLYLELLHRQDHILTLYLKDDEGLKHKISFCITAKEEIRTAETTATFTVRWLDHPDWKSSYENYLQLLRDVDCRSQPTICPPVLNYPKSHYLCGTLYAHRLVSTGYPAGQ